jgi:hypothetical protein
MGKKEQQNNQQYNDGGWMDLRTLAAYGCVCQKTLREWIRSIHDPLPAFQRGNKLYVYRIEYDKWLRKHPVQELRNIEGVVNDLISELGE